MCHNFLVIFIIAHPLAYYVKYVLLETTHQLSVHEEAPRQEAAIHFDPENFRHNGKKNKFRHIENNSSVCVALYKQNQPQAGRTKRTVSRVG